MTIDTINALINLKENEIIEFGAVYPTINNGKITLTHYFDYKFENFISQFQPQIFGCSTMITSIFNKEIKEDIRKDNCKNILKLDLTPAKNGFKLNIKSDYLDTYMTEIRDGDFRENINLLVDSINTVTNDIKKTSMK